MKIVETTPSDRTFNLEELTGNELLIIRNALEDSTTKKNWTKDAIPVLNELVRFFNSQTNDLHWISKE